MGLVMSKMPCPGQPMSQHQNLVSPALRKNNFPNNQKVSHLRIPQYMAGNAQLVVALLVNRHTLNSLAVMDLE